METSNQTRLMYDIFVSYKSDDADRARVFAEAFEKEGYAVWWDHTIPPGKTWAQMIEEAIKTSRCVVVLWSKNSIGSDWVNKEARKGHQRRVLMPALIDEVDVPFEFEHVQAAKLMGWKGQRGDPEFQRMLEEIATVIETRPTEASPSVLASKSPRPSGGVNAMDRLKNPKVLGGVGIVAVLGVVIASMGDGETDPFVPLDPQTSTGLVEPALDELQAGGAAVVPPTTEASVEEPAPSTAEPIAQPSTQQALPSTQPPVQALPSDPLPPDLEPEPTSPDYLGQLSAQLAEIEGVMIGQGFVPLDSRTGQLSADAVDEVPLVVAPGVEYAVAGVCDADCSDIDLEIYDGLGNLLDGDYEIDAQPVVYATALTAGSFSVLLDMVDCVTSVCYYSIAVFTRGF